jgi:hypothetical protein
MSDVTAPDLAFIAALVLLSVLVSAWFILLVAAYGVVLIVMEIADE